MYVFRKMQVYKRIIYNPPNSNFLRFLKMAKQRNSNEDCTASNVELKSTEHQSEDYQSTSKHIEEADTFGTLKKSLEIKKKAHVFQKKSFHDSNARKVYINKPKLSDEADTFGNLSSEKPMWYPDLKEESEEYNDQIDDNSTFVMPKREKKFRNAKAYLQEMRNLVNQKKLKEALDLFVHMKRYGVTPINGNYTYMIGACGQFGYTEMAFKLLRQMTDKGFHPTAATLTGLFNSCAESPFPEYGLKKAHFLKEKAKTKNYELNQITYHAMIKAFGKCGDIQTAFQIVDEMAAEKIKIDVSTYSFLLMSCISDKEAGFTHAVEVWRKMQSKKLLPNLFTCNLLLRAVRECEVGPPEVSCLLLQHWTSFPKRPYGFETKKMAPKDVLRLQNPLYPAVYNATETTNQIKEDAPDVSDTNKTNSSRLKMDPCDTETKSDDSVQIFKETKSDLCTVKNQPNLLAVRPLEGPEYADIININRRNDRLALLGGAEGFLNYMTENKIKPNIKTFMLLLESLQLDAESEHKFIDLMDVYKVKPDIAFFNILIKRRNFRKDNFAAKKVLLLINKYGLSPDIITFGVLALGCHTRNQGSFLMNDMQKLGLCPNVEIIGALLANAKKKMDFAYLEDILKLMEKEQVRPDGSTIKKLEDILEVARKNIIDMEHGKEVSKVYRQPDFTLKYKHFCSIYEEWLKSMDIDPEQHPWEQYKTDITFRLKNEVYHHTV